MVRPAGSAPRVPPLTVMAWLRFDAIRAAVAAAEPGSVLEVGCGQGAMATWLAARARYTGVEPDPAARAVAARRLAGRPGTQVLTSVEETAGLTVDLVCAFEVLEHVEDDVGLLTTLRSRLTPGGRLLLSVPAHPDRYGPSDALVGHFRRYTRAGLERVVRAAGFDGVVIESYGSGAGHVLDRLQDTIARRRLAGRHASVPAAPAAVAAGTAASGRHLQPTSAAGAAVRAGVAAPFRAVQWPFRHTDAGVGYVVSAVVADRGDA